VDALIDDGDAISKQVRLFYQKARHKIEEHSFSMSFNFPAKTSKKRVLLGYLCLWRLN